MTVACPGENNGRINLQEWVDYVQGSFLNYVEVGRLGLTLWNQSSFEFKFDDTRLSS